jgi:hypothetical protein
VKVWCWEQKSTLHSSHWQEDVATQIDMVSAQGCVICTADDGFVIAAEHSFMPCIAGT